jgi:hypothetical protein
MLFEISGTTSKTARGCAGALTAESQRHLLQFGGQAGRFVFLGREAGQTKRRIPYGALLNSATASLVFV